MTGHRRLRVAAALVLATVALALPAPAWGHSSELATSPAADAVLESPPDEVSIEFDSPLLDMGAALVVRDARGASIVVGPPEVGRTTLAVRVDPGAGPGVYRVAYRVVSQDGHTIESSFAYTVAGTASPSAPASASAPAVPATPSPPATPDSAGAADSRPWVVAGGALVLILVVGGALALRR